MNKIVSYIFLLVTAVAFSQEKDKHLPEGNRSFMKKEYAEAEAYYRISGSKAPAKATASYNLGNSIYRQGMAGEAKYPYLRAIENARTKQQKHMAYHNLGNSLMKEKNYQAAVEAYKHALRNNPHDDETRYNFALAKKMLKENPPKEDKKDNKKDQQDKDKQEQNKNQQPNEPKDQKNKGGEGDKDDKGKGDQKDKGDRGNEKDKGDQGRNKQEKGGGGNEKAPAQPSPGKQRMENLLDAMNNEEKKVQDRVNATKAKSRPVKQEKDW